MLSALFGCALALHPQTSNTPSAAARQRAGLNDAALLQLLQNHQYLELETALRLTRGGDPVQRAFLKVCWRIEVGYASEVLQNKSGVNQVGWKRVMMFLKS